MPRLILHVGPHKTGTTYLQQSLHRASEMLKGQSVHYGFSGDQSVNAHHAIAESLLRERLEAGEAARQIFELAGAFDTCIMSSETFSLFPAKLWQELFECLRGHFEVLVVAYIRSRSALTYSSWQESIKHGHTDSLREYVTSRLLRPHQNPQMNLLNVIDRLPDGLKKTVKIVVYDNLQADGTDLADHFLRDIVGVDIGDGVGIGKRVNKSMRSEDLEIMRRLNLISAKKGMPKTHFFRKALFQAKNADAIIGEEFQSLRALIAGETEMIDLSPLDFNFDYLDKILATRFGKQIVNPISKDPFKIAEWKPQSEFVMLSQSHICEPQIWSRLLALHDLVCARMQPK